MGNLKQDLRFGIRMLLKNPGIAAIALLALALGIGANTAIFSVINTVLLRPLPFKNPEELVVIWEKREPVNRSVVSYPDFADWRDQNRVFEHVAAYRYSGVLLLGTDEPELLRGVEVSADIFPLLGVQPVLGRAFKREEEVPGSPQVIVISYGLWKRRFGSDTGIVGKEIRLSGRNALVLGVMPPDFKFPVNNNQMDFMMPLLSNLSSKEIEARDSRFLQVVARLKSDVPLLQAQSEMDTIARRIEKQFPSSNFGIGASLDSMHEDLVRSIKWALIVLFGAVGFVLLIACANVANLLLARAAGRTREIAIRSALGAGRLRIVQQLLTESMLLSLCGGAIGLLLALWGVDLLISASPVNIPRIKESSLDGRVLLFTMATSMMTGILFGLVPALWVSKPQLNEALKEGGRFSMGSLRQSRIHSLLVVSEVALSLVLLIGAGLLTRSFLHLRSSSPGFNPENVFTVSLSLSGKKYQEAEQQINFFKEVNERIASLPGIKSVGAVDPLPLSGTIHIITFTIEDAPPVPPGQEPGANYRIVSPGYFRTMEIPLLKGRYFTEQDTKTTTQTLIINETFARRFFHNEDPIGRRILIDEGNPPPREIIGVVGDVKHSSLDAEAGPEYYVSHLQTPDRYMSLVFKTATETPTGFTQVREAIKQVNREQFIPEIRKMDDLLDESVAQRRFNMLLLGLFASVALILATVGIYGVISYSVAQRTHEIGIRIALGAQPGDVLRLVMRHGIVLALLGVLLGLIASLALTQFLSSLLYEISSTDAGTYIAISVLLTGVALLASYIPARRATKVDPIVAMRCD